MNDIRTAVYYKIRRHDVELAETFMRACPEVKSVPELNQFFHGILTQYSTPVIKERLCLDDTFTLDHWMRHFDQTVIPKLVELRFPSVKLNPQYDVASSLVRH